MEITDLKKKLKEIVSNNLDDAIDELSKVVSLNSKLHDDIIHQKGRLKKINKEFDNGVISRKDFDLNLNKIRKAIINIIGEIKIENLGKQERTSKALEVQKPNTMGNIAILIGVIFLLTISYIVYQNIKPANSYQEDKIYLEKYEQKVLKDILSNTTWQGGKNWGKVYFDEKGTRASYTNTNGKSGGEIQITKFNGYFFTGNWKQIDNKVGHFFLAIPSDLYDSDQVEDFKLKAAWTIDKASIPDQEFWQEWTKIKK